MTKLPGSGGGGYTDYRACPVFEAYDRQNNKWIALSRYPGAGDQAGTAMAARLIEMGEVQVDVESGLLMWGLKAGQATPEIDYDGLGLKSPRDLGNRLEPLSLKDLHASPGFLANGAVMFEN